MGNRSINDKWLRSRRNAAQVAYFHDSNRDAKFKELAHVSEQHIASGVVKVTRFETGKASGLHKDVGTCGKNNARRETSCHGDGTRRVRVVDASCYGGYDTIWSLFKPE